MNRNIRYLSLLIVGVLFVVLGSCHGGDGSGGVLGGGGGGGGGGQQGVVLAAETVLPENEPWYDGVVVGDEQLTFTTSGSSSGGVIGGSSEGSAPLAPGAIVVGSSGGGYLRRVLSVEQEGNQLSVTTENASLTDAIQDGSYSQVIDLTGVSGKGDSPFETSRHGLNNLVDLSGTVLYQGQAGGADVRIEITNGGVSFEPQVQVDADIGWFKITYFRAAAVGNLDFDIDVLAEVSDSVSKSDEVEVASYTHPFAGAIGPVPVVGYVEVGFYAGYELEANAEGSVTAGFDAGASIAVGAEYSGGSWSDIWDPQLDANVHPPEWTISGDVKVRAYVRPQIKAIFYAVGGPSLDVEPYLAFAADFPPPCYELSAGLSAHVGLHLEIFMISLAEYNKELFDWSKVIADGCLECGDGVCAPGEQVSCPDDCQSEPPFKDPSDDNTTDVDVTITQVDASNAPGEVKLYASVTTQQGEPLEKLTAGNFSVEETIGGASSYAHIDSVKSSESAGESISVCLVIDSSGSMDEGPGSDLEAAVSAAKMFVDKMNSGDKAAVIDFSSDVTLLQDFTSNKSQLKSAIDAVEPDGGTALWNAVVEAVDVTSGQAGQRAVVALTDGEDTDSWYSLSEAIDAGKSAGVPVYTIGLGVDSWTEDDLISLSNGTNAGKNGSGYFAAPDSSDLQDLYDLISDTLKQVYVITWTSNGKSGDAVDVEISVTYTCANGTFTDTFDSLYSIP